MLGTRKRNIFRKLFITYLIIIFCSFILFSSIFYALYHNELSQKHEELAKQQLGQYEHLIRLAHVQGWSEETLISTLDHGIYHEKLNVFTFDADGRLLYHTPTDAVPSVELDLVQRILEAGFVSQRYKLDGDRMLMFASAISPVDELMEERILLMLFEGVGKEVLHHAYMYLSAALITTVVTALGIYIVSKKITSPLREMSRVAQNYAKGNFEQKVEVKEDDEIGQLAAALNNMAAELADLERVRSEFVANVSHDLRSPLTSIHGFLGALLDGTIPEERQRHYILLMKNETTRLIKLVNDLLDMAQIEAGTIVIRPAPYNISEQIRKIIAKLEPEISKHHLELKLITNEEDLIVFADEDRLEQVLFNLIQNAIQHSPAGGHIDISLTGGEKVFIAIADYGTGIRDEDLSKIWDRFYKGDKARSKKTGTGIGLSIVKYILSLHGVSIQVDSRWGEGTTFSFSLPLVDRA
jgi:signal transduction histidine kinase